MWNMNSTTVLIQMATMQGDPKLRVTKTWCHKLTYLHKNEL
jgi:hypothetical protein